MPLPAGARLGPYEILAAIGAGGMGEVYRARDTRLDRIVAIKVLPEMRTAIKAGTELAFEPPVALLRTRLSRAGQPPSYDIAPDGRFLFVRTLEGQAPINLVVAVNWTEELKQRVPIK